MDISVSNTKDIINNFISLSNKYVWVCLAFMVDTCADENSIFSQVEQIRISDMHRKEHGYFGLPGIVNVGNKVLPNPLLVSHP